MTQPAPEQKVSMLLQEILEVADFGNRSDGDMCLIMNRAATALEIVDPTVDVSPYFPERGLK